MRYILINSLSIINNTKFNYIWDNRTRRITPVPENLNSFVQMSKMLFFAQNRRMGPPPQFSVQPTSLSFGFNASSKQLTINSNYPWSYVSGETSWCTIDTKSGDGEGADTVNVSVTENTSTSDTRSATLLFRNEKGLEARVSVSQAVHEAYTISVQPTSVTLQKASGSQASITISANQGWTISGTPAWATLSKNSGNGNDTVTITAASENTSTDERSATLTISGSQSGSATVTLKQNATEVVWSVSPDSISIEANDTSDHAITVSSNTNWTITGYPDWVQVSKSSGTGNDTVNVKAKAEYTGDSQRSGTIAFQNAKGSTINVTITQSAATITYADPIISIQATSRIPASGEEIEVAYIVRIVQTYGYNGATTGAGTIEWNNTDETPCPLSNVSVTGYSKANVKENYKVYASAENLGTTLKEQTTLTASATLQGSMNGKTGTSAAFNIIQEANKVKSINALVGYLSTLEGTSGNMTAPFVEAAEIPVEASGPGASKEIGVIPALAPSFTYTSGAKGETLYPEDIMNKTVTVPWEGDVAWSKINFTNPSMIASGSGKEFRGFPTFPGLIGNVGENTGEARKGTLTATMTVTIGGEPFNYDGEWTVSQKATENYLNVSPQTLSFEASGGSKEITIDTNESWTIS